MTATELTRQRLIRTALELFTTRGYHDTTLPEIAEAADVSTRTIFAYFPSKEDILFSDFALMKDALARAHGLPLARLLGATLKPIPAYGATGYDGAQDSARVAAEWAERGFTGVKAKIGYPDVREDVEVVRAMRRAVGDGVSLMVDYNQSLAPTDAIERGRRLDDEGLTWIEEPTLADDYAGHARIAREVRTPIQCGENWWGTHDMRKAIDAGQDFGVLNDGAMLHLAGHQMLAVPVEK